MRILVGADNFTPSQLDGLLPGWDVLAVRPERVAEHIDGVDILCPIRARVDAGLIAAGRFGLVQQFGVGLDNVDVPAATEAGVLVARIPGDVSGNADSVAEMAVLHALSLSRKLDEARQALRDGRWSEPAGTALLDGTAVIVGLGTIGVAVAKRLAAFGMRLLAVREHPEHGGPPEVAGVFGPDRLHDVLAEADVVISCVLFEDHNRNLFDARAFAAMRPGALFVNVARGGLVDEAALLAALESGHLGGAGLDVHAVEPADPASPLVRHPRVIATPHVAGVTGLMLRRTMIAFADNVKRWVAGQTPLWTVNSPSEAAQRRPQR